MLLKMVSPDTKIRFLKNRIIMLVFSSLMVLASIILFLTQGLNKGIDFEGGILMEVGSPEAVDLKVFRDTIRSLGLGDVQIQSFGTDTDVLIRIERQTPPEDSDVSDADAQQVAVRLVQGALNDQMEGLSYRRVEFVGPKVSGELIVSGFMSVGFAVLAVLVYIWFRFEWHFGVGAVVALIHDVLLTIGFFSITGLEFNLSIIAAILTIIGYSLNDTVVVYDRVRENLRKFHKMPLEELLNLSLNQTLSRTLMTSVSTLLALFSLFYFGGAVIQGFTAAMIWGVFVGTYSSVFIAAPMLIYLKLRSSDVSLQTGDKRTP